MRQSRFRAPPRAVEPEPAVDQPPTFVAPAPGQQPDPILAFQMFPVLEPVVIQRVQRFGE